MIIRSCLNYSASANFIYFMHNITLLYMLNLSALTLNAYDVVRAVPRHTSTWDTSWKRNSHTKTQR